MKHYENGCARSEIKVTPAGWDVDMAQASERTVARLLKKKWKIYYRYYDPAFKGTKKWGLPVQIRGMNEFKDLERRQSATRVLLDSEKEKLDNQGYNPITGRYHQAGPDHQVEEITPSMLFCDALKKALPMVNAVPRCKDDIKSAIRGIEKAAGKLYEKAYQKPYTALKISQVTRKHLVYIFQQCKKDNSRFTANRQNKYRSYLIMLFKELVRVEAVDVNPANDLAIDYTHVKAKRQTLTEAEALIIDTNLKAWDYYYWRFMRIFYRSGSRETEMLSLTTDKVDIQKQEFYLLIKKGKKYEWETRPIPDDALRFWIEVLEECNPGDFLFSVGFKPGPRKIGHDNVPKRWKKYVKDDPPQQPVTPVKDKRKLPKRKFIPLGIKKDFYSLKHKNLDKIAEKLSLKNAQEAAGHTSASTTKIYTVGEAQRETDKLKKVHVDFVS
jgi:site-specific recombinase XerC